MRLGNTRCNLTQPREASIAACTCPSAALARLEGQDGSEDACEPTAGYKPTEQLCHAARSPMAPHDSDSASCDGLHQLC